MFKIGRKIKYFQNWLKSSMFKIGHINTDAQTPTAEINTVFNIYTVSGMLKSGPELIQT